MSLAYLEELEQQLSEEGDQQTIQQEIKDLESLIPDIDSKVNVLGKKWEGRAIRNDTRLHRLNNSSFLRHCMHNVESSTAHVHHTPSSLSPSRG